MAADKATVSVSASLLPDEIKTTIGGTTVYNLDDLGDLEEIDDPTQPSIASGNSTWSGPSARPS